MLGSPVDDDVHRAPRAWRVTGGGGRPGFPLGPIASSVTDSRDPLHTRKARRAGAG